MPQLPIRNPLIVGEFPANFMFSHAAGGTAYALNELARYNPTIYREGSGDGFQRESDADTDAKRFVRNALGRALGRRLNTTDTRSIRASVDRAFTETINEDGSQVFEWTPRSYAAQTELGGEITGAQASLYRRAKLALDDILSIIDRLEPLRNDPDPEEVEAIRTIVRQEIAELVDEFGTEGGSRENRVNLLFENLLGSKRLRRVGHLDQMAEIYGFQSKKGVSIVTIGEEEIVTDFMVIEDHIISLRKSWRKIIGKDDSQFLGNQVVLLERALNSVAEGVDELRYVMESVGLGDAERRVIPLNYIERGWDFLARPLIFERNFELSVSEMLDWVMGFATEEAPGLIEGAGRLGIESIIPTASRLVQIVDEAAGANDTHNALQTTRVTAAFDELASHIYYVEKIACQHCGLDVLRSPRHRMQYTDDLTRINGIGSVISDALKQAGFYSFELLSILDESKLRKVVQDAGITAPGSLPNWSKEAQALL